MTSSGLMSRLERGLASVLAYYLSMFWLDGANLRSEAREFARYPAGSGRARPEMFAQYLASIELDPLGPRSKQLLRLYNLGSNAMHMYMVVRALAGRVQPELLECRLPGRMFVYMDVGEYIIPLMSLCVLIWRLVQRLKPPPLHLDAFTFVLQEPAAVAQVEARLVARKRSRAPLKPSPLELSRNMRLTELMSYKPSPKRSQRPTIRPNRTSAARLRLGRAAVLMVCGHLGPLFLAFLVMWPAVAVYMLTDVCHARRYPKCAFGWAGSEPSYFQHKLIALPVDYALNAAFVWDMSMAFTSYTLIIGLIVYDLHAYWLQVSLRLETTLELVRRCARQLEPQPDWPEEPAPRELPKAAHIYLMEQGLLPTRSHSANSLSGVRPQSAYRQLDAKVFRLQAELHDFYRQFERADSLVTEHLTCGMGIWLLTFGLLCYLPLRQGLALKLGVVLFQVAFFVTVSLSSAAVIYMHSRSLVLHRLVCSLMALDQSEHKAHFRPILDYYLFGNRCAFTLFRGQFAFRSTTYMTLMGWSVSVMVIVHNMSAR